MASRPERLGSGRRLSSTTALRVHRQREEIASTSGSVLQVHEVEKSLKNMGGLPTCWGKAPSVSTLRKRPSVAPELQRTTETILVGGRPSIHNRVPWREVTKQVPTPSPTPDATQAGHRRANDGGVRRAAPQVGSPTSWGFAVKENREAPPRQAQGGGYGGANLGLGLGSQASGRTSKNSCGNRSPTVQLQRPSTSHGGGMPTGTRNEWWDAQFEKERPSTAAARAAGVVHVDRKPGQGAAASLPPHPGSRGGSRPATTRHKLSRRGLSLGAQQQGERPSTSQAAGARSGPGEWVENLADRPSTTTGIGRRGEGQWAQSQTGGVAGASTSGRTEEGATSTSGESAAAHAAARRRAQSQRARAFFTRSSDCGDITVDYYELMGLAKDASLLEVRAAFKKLALKLHPDKQSSAAGLLVEMNGEMLSREETAQRWTQVGEAHRVLSNPQRREDYDIARELHLALQRQKVRWSARRRDPATAASAPFREPSTAEEAPPEKAKNKRVDVEVYLPADKLHMGGTKVVKFIQARMGVTGRLSMLEKHFQLNIRKNSSDGEYVEFAGEGHESHECRAGDLRFVLRASQLQEPFKVRLAKEVRSVYQNMKKSNKPFFQRKVNSDAVRLPANTSKPYKSIVSVI